MKLFKAIRRLLEFFLKKLNMIGEYVKYRRKIKEELKLNPRDKITKKDKEQFKSYYKSFGFRHIKEYWHQYYSGFGQGFSKEIIPQDLFFAHIEGALNDYKFYNLQDKNLLNKLLPDTNQPETLVKNINGFYFIEDDLVSFDKVISHLSSQKDLIIKPSIETGGGRGIKKFSIKDGITSLNEMSVIDLLKSYKMNFLIQRAVEQSAIINDLNSSSLNTIRIATYLNEEEVGVLFAIIRIGKEGDFLDNISKGGFYAAIDSFGHLDKYAYNTGMETITRLENGTALENFQIPNYKEVIKCVEKMHPQLPYFKVISWDIAIDKNNMPVVIEFNSFGQSIDFQTVCGPFFGKYTDEVLRIVQEKLKS